MNTQYSLRQPAATVDPVQVYINWHNHRENNFFSLCYLTCLKPIPSYFKAQAVLSSPNCFQVDDGKSQIACTYGPQDKPRSGQFQLIDGDGNKVEEQYPGNGFVLFHSEDIKLGHTYVVSAKHFNPVEVYLKSTSINEYLHRVYLQFHNLHWILSIPGVMNTCLYISTNGHVHF